MKKIAGLLLCGSLLLNSFALEAQSYAESALLYSRLMPAGSARIQGLGGAQVSLGGDYSSAGSNPAGLGMFNKSEFTFSPAINFGSSTSQFYTQPTGGNSLSSTNASKSTFEIPGLSAVFHKTYANGGDFDDQKKTFIGGSFGITVSRTNDFNRSFSYDGDNPRTSLVDYFIQNASANGDVSQFNPPDPNTGVSGYNYGYPTFLAYDSYLIDSTKSRSKNPYYSVLSTDPTNPNDTRTVHQHENVNISGAQNQVNLAYGVNILDKIFFGGGVGVSIMNYHSSKVFTESNYRFGMDHGNYVNSITLGEDLVSKGIGINLNVGIIARPVDFVQIGLSYSSPTYSSLHDTYTAYLTTDYNQNFTSGYYGYTNNLALGGVGTDTGPPILTQSYNLTTPARINLGATVFILKQGFITADVERVNYPGAKYGAGSSGIDFSQDNSDTKQSVQATFNYRAGAEYRYKNFRIRAGYSFMPTPYINSQYVSTNYSYGVKQDITSVSGGLGYRTNKFSLDLAYVARQTASGYTPYSTQDYNTFDNNSPRVTTKTNSNLIMVTLGLPIKMRR